MKIIGLTNSRGWKLKEPLQSGNVENVCIDIHTNGLVQYIISIIYGVKLIHREKPDALIANNDGVLGFTCVFIGTIFDLPTFIHLGGNAWSGHRERAKFGFISRNYKLFSKHILILFLNKLTFRLVSGCLAVSYKTENDILFNTSINPECIRVVRTPVKDSKMYSNFTDVGESDTPLALTVTNLDFKGKCNALKEGLPEIVRFLKKHEGLKYVIVGDGIYLSELRNYIDANAPENIKHRIELEGYKDNVGRYYRDADIFIYLSNDDGYPTVILEAQMYRLPVVTNRSQGMAEQIIEGYNGLFCNLDKSGDLYWCINNIMNNNELKKSLGTNGYEVATTNNNVQKIGSDMDAQIRAILQTKNKI